MDIDISVLRLMEREKDLPFELLAKAIEEALLTAYEKTDGAVEGARVVLNRKSGHVVVLVPERDDEGNRARRVRRDAGGFRPGRRLDRSAGDHAAAAGRRGRAEVRALLRHRGRHRLRRRPAGPRLPYGAGRSGQDRGDHAAGRAGARRALRPRHPDQGLRGRGAQGAARAAGDRVPDPPRVWWRSCSSWRFPRSRTARSRSRRWPERRGIAARSPWSATTPTSARRGPASGPMGQRVRAVMHELNEEKIDPGLIHDGSCQGRKGWPDLQVERGYH